MAENSTQDPVAASETPAKTTEKEQTHGLIDADLLRELTLAEDVAKAARVPERVEVLKKQDVTPEFVADFVARNGQARQLLVAIQNAHSGGLGATSDETEALNALFDAAGPLQSAARRKFSRKHSERLSLYACGNGLDLSNMSRDELLLAIPTLIQAAKDDGLSGDNNEKTAVVQAAFDAWNAFNDKQGGSHTDETEARETLLNLLFGANRKGETGIAADRRTVQYGADGAFPPGTNLGTRREFHLQDNRRFSG